MSRIVLRVAQIVGVLVLAGIAIGVVVGLVQWLLGARTDRLDPAGRLVALPPGQGPRPRAPAVTGRSGGPARPSSRAAR